jgi:adenylate cyclase
MVYSLLKIPAVAVRRFIDRYANIGLDTASDTERSRRYAFNMFCLMGATVAVSYAAFYMIYDFEGLWPVWLTAISIIVIGFAPLLAKHNRRFGLLGTIGLLIVGLSTVTSFLGTDSGIHIFIVAVAIMPALFHGSDGLWESVAITCCCCLAIMVCVIFFQEPSGLARVDAQLQFIASIGVALTAPPVAVIGVIVLSARLADAEAALSAEHARSEALLDNLLPTEIAARLKSSPGEIIADNIPNVTILFADIVDFTPRASTMRPEELVGFLNRVFTEFDHLTDRFGLEKIKTIGDAYMVAAGMPKNRPDHAQAVADMALAMLEATNRLTNETGESIEVRIGLHTGAAIAGVIGTQKMFYDVWGDTVNTASRMESHGDAGRIQLTGETRDRLGDAYLFKERGMIDIKGKGEIKTFWLIGKASIT